MRAKLKLSESSDDLIIHYWTKWHRRTVGFVDQMSNKMLRARTARVILRVSSLPPPTIAPRATIDAKIFDNFQETFKHRVGRNFLLHKVGSSRK